MVDGYVYMAVLSCAYTGVSRQYKYISSYRATMGRQNKTLTLGQS